MAKLSVNRKQYEVDADPNTPLVFRPTDGLYNPGSTFKSVTAAACTIDENMAHGLDGRAPVVRRREGVQDLQVAARDPGLLGILPHPAAQGLRVLRGPDDVWRIAEWNAAPFEAEPSIARELAGATLGLVG